jgi:hypothetical protein
VRLELVIDGAAKSRIHDTEWGVQIIGDMLLFIQQNYCSYFEHGGKRE